MTPTTAAGITTSPIAGTARRLAIRPYCATTLKWKAEIGAGREPGDERGDRDPEHRPGEAPARRDLGMDPPRAPAQRLVGGDERDGRRERHLEAGLGQALGRDGENEERRERDRAHGQRRAIEEDGDEDHRRHDIGALRRDVAARDQQVGAGGDERDDGGDLLQRPVQRQPRHQRAAAADDREDRGGEQRHVEARDRDDVVEARHPQRVLGRAVDARAVAGQDRRGEGAVLPGHQPLDVRRGRHPDAEGELGERARAAALGLDAPASGHSRPRRFPRTRRPGGSRSRRARTAPPAATAAPGREGGGPGRSRSGGVAGSSEMRTRAGVSAGSRPWITTRSSRMRGRSEADRSRPTTRPSTLTVISAARRGAATDRLRSAARPKPRPGRRRARSATRAIGAGPRRARGDRRRGRRASAASIHGAGSSGTAK